MILGRWKVGEMSRGKRIDAIFGGIFGLIMRGQKTREMSVGRQVRLIKKM